MLEHGGKLQDASQKYGIPLDQWIDLSTGINPRGWMPPRPPDSVWLRLPEEHDELEQVACSYYGCDSLLAVAGSQQAIQLLPTLRSRSKVGFVSPGYGEHPYAWKCHNHQVRPIAADEVERHLDEIDVLVLCNPNNPDGGLFTAAQLSAWHERLNARGGWLIVDEAFMDATPQWSLAKTVPLGGLIILRSLGKFFGLAGARVGFVLADNPLLLQMREKLGPWTIAGPSRWVAAKALADSEWQTKARQELGLAADRLKRLLSGAGLPPRGGTVLFQYVRHREAGQIAHLLAQEGILVRLFSEPASLRFGLPGTADEWARMEACFKRLFR
ncbi:threonine-phosphate decarboxylase CobD [Sedimenticola thiotaurini]|uniref:threonine-phosphate decarboxylase n=1 Tax=Sedimenticola thiotaurini TaxID=1543721 RepID=A0A0F7JW36_9GAMM|nr:threonine-phosphate decarboxylase CobD [Sedimenticola thiotaurini]AKH19574.1 threonine-phosphate decarboxylase [Sedimenticola thiotaurini]